MAPAHSPYYWLAEPLFAEQSLVQKRMFGCDALYLHGRLMLVLTDGEAEPWKGILIPTDKTRHAALRAEFPELISHPVLGKWLYVSAELPCFEDTAEVLVKRILENDERIGVAPSAKRKVKKRIRKR